MLSKIKWLLFIVPLLFIACGGPSNSDIEIAVTNSLKNKVPVQLSGYMGGGKKATVDDINIIEIGESQGEGAAEYWPVKVYVSGECTGGFGGLLGSERKSYKGETVYNISQDSFGEWKASHDGW